MRVTAPNASTICAGCLRSRCGTIAAAALFCARDRFGIKPFYYAVVGTQVVFASEAKALLPFLPEIATDPAALAEYSLTFQYSLGEATLFRGVKQLMPGHALAVENGRVRVWRYWDVRYEIDFDHNARYFEHRLVELLDDTVRMHLRSDVPVGAYVSGSLDSSLIAILAGQSGRGIAECFPRPFHTEFGLRRGDSPGPRRIGPAPGCTPSTSPPVTSATTSRTLSTTSISRWPGRVVSAIHGVEAGRRAPQGGSRRAGRRRGLWRLCPLSARLFRAMHQGRDRRHLPERQLCRDDRVQSCRTWACSANTSP